MSRQTKTRALVALLGVVLLGLGLWLSLRENYGCLTKAVERVPIVDVPSAERTRQIAEPLGVPSDRAMDAEPSWGEREAVAFVPDTAALTVEFVDRTSGVVVDGMLQLWRIGLAEDEDWTAGDKRIQHLTTQKGQAVFNPIPPGLYRIEAGMARPGHGDLDEFTVEAGSNFMRFEVDAALRRPVQIAVVDQAGRPWGAAVQFKWMQTVSGVRFDRDPEWAQPRQSKGEDFAGVRWGGSGHYRTSHRTYRSHALGPLGFEVGDRDPASVAKTYLHLWNLRLTRNAPQPIPFNASAAFEAALTGWSTSERAKSLEAGEWPLEQRFELALEVDDVGGPGFVVVAVDPYSLIDRLEGVADRDLGELLEGLTVTCQAAPIRPADPDANDVTLDRTTTSTPSTTSEMNLSAIETSAQAASVVIELVLDGRTRLHTKWFPAREPMPRLIVAPTNSGGALGR